VTEPTDAASVLSDERRERYGAQLAVEGFDELAQARLQRASVHVVGAGARGCIAAAYLAAAGVGHIAVIDGAQVTTDQLYRQLLHFTPDVTANKAESLRAKLALTNPEVHVDPFPANVDASNAEMILLGADCVLDCTNDRATSRLLNASCVKAGLPAIFGWADGWRGSLFSVLPGRSACLQCAEPVGTGPQDGVEAQFAAALGPVAGTIGSMQALEALKIVSGAGKPHSDGILLLDGRDLTCRTEAVSRRPDCICASG
jgi:molybdopterin/thiamine biosynthesis adenylyltransferase